jgi:hypothetical protein
MSRTGVAEFSERLGRELAENPVHVANAGLGSSKSAAD